MFAAVTHVKTKSLGKVSDMAKKVDLPDIKTVPGFIAYYTFIGDEKDNYTTIAVFEDMIGYEKWNDMCRDTFAGAKKHFSGTDAVET